jgi:hypothetical protein
MGDLLVLVLIVVVPAAALLGPLAILTLGLAAVADIDGNGLVRSSAPFASAERRAQPAAGSLSSEIAAGAAAWRS